jgi:hypothetical protein
MQYITPDLRSFERKDFSQFNEDGVIEQINADLGIKEGTFFEFGIGPSDGVSFHHELEGNCVALRKRGYRGVFLDGQHLPPHCGVRQEFVTALNINHLYVKHALPDDLDVMSIDVDGQEFWIWMALQYRPKIVIIEYNNGLGPEASLTVPFDVSFRWDGTIYQGASLKALYKLSIAKRYTLVYTNGVNAIFIRDDLISNKSDFSYDRLCLSDFPAHGPDLLQRSWVTV